jgi:hypothetical protein
MHCLEISLEYPPYYAGGIGPFVYVLAQARPVYYPGVIEGHCIITNAEKLLSVYRSEFAEALQQERATGAVS